MRSRLRCCLLAIAAGSLLEAGNTPRESLLVLSKADRALAIVDPSTLSVIARVPVGDDPHEVIASSDGTVAYVSNYGFGAYNTLTVIDLVAQKALPPIDLGPLRGPHGLVFAGGKIWFTAEGAKAIGSYDPAQKKVDWTMGTGQNRTHMIYISPDLHHIVTSNVSSATVSLIDKSTRTGPDFGPPPGAGHGSGAPPPDRGNHPRPMGAPGGEWDQTVVSVGRGAEGFDVSPDGKQIWVANAQDGTVSILDAATRKVTETLPPDYRGANRLKFTPDGKRVFISARTLAIVDAATHKQIKRMDTVGSDAGIQMKPDGSRAYVSCNHDGYVAVIDSKSLEAIGKIDAGPQPDGLAWAIRP